MATNPDDDALRWEGGTDPTLDAPARRRPPAHPESEAPADESDPPDKWSNPAAPAADALPAATPPADSFALAMGVLGGIYFLYTLGWFISTSRAGNPLADPVGAFMFSLGAWLAVAAPLIWFGTAAWLTGGRPRLRIGWLLVGVVLLAPMPVILGVGGVS